MNTFEKHLLKLAYGNFRKNGSSYTEFQVRNSDEILYYSDAIEYLEEDEHVIIHSNDLASNSIVISSNGLWICYELSDSGLSIAREQP